MKIAGGLTMLLLLVHSTIEEEDEEEKEDEEEDDFGDSRPQLPPGDDFLRVILREVDDMMGICVDA